MPSSAVTAQRRQLDRLHSQTAREVRAAFVAARSQVTPALSRFADAYGAELKRVQVNGWDMIDGEPDTRQHVSLLWLHTSGHLASLKGPVSSALQQATHASHAATLFGQRQTMQEAQKTGSAMLSQMLDDDGDDDQGAPIIPPIPPERIGRSGYDGRSLASLFDQLPPNAWQRIEKAANAAAATGQSGDDLLTALEDVLAGIASWALLIALQELTNAWRFIMNLIFGANQTNWRWRAQPDACDFCLSMDGTVHSGDESLDSHPRCRCIQEPTNDPVTS